MSFNIWADAPGLASWNRRKDALAAVIREADPDLLGLQEATLPMIRDLEKMLGDFSWVGRGREDGLEKGEFTPIFYRSDRVRLLEHATFWLAANCDSPNKGWDALCKRTLTWARFDELKSGLPCVHFNTHL